MSRLALMHEPYFVQHVTMLNRYEGRSRPDAFAEIVLNNKRTLHVGCADSPITDISSSLHIDLERRCGPIDGLDLDASALDLLRPHAKGEFYSDITDVPVGAYDLVLVPEVIEHVENAGSFLQALDRLSASMYVITVPDAFSCREAHLERVNQNEFVEVVHPEHLCWYTPYTLTNLIRRATPWKLKEMSFFNRISILGIFTR